MLTLAALAEKNTRRANVALLLGGVLLGLAWIFPLSITGAAFNLCGFLALIAGVRKLKDPRSSHSYGMILLAGIVSHAIAFYWIFATIKNFGGFPTIAASLLFLLFITLSSIQFPLFLFLFNFLPRTLDRIAIRTPLAWISIEILAIRIFPWSAGHPLSATLSLVQLAEYGGIQVVSFLFLWFCETLIIAVFRKKVLLLVTTVGTSFLISYFGSSQRNQIEQLMSDSRKLPVVMIQGNIPLSAKHDRSLVVSNLRKYLQLSLPFDTPGTLIVWPETVLMDWLPEKTTHVSEDRRLPRFNGGASLLFGALSFGPQEELYNSAFAIDASGSLPRPYHKRILMPFGEFTPFAEYFPYLRTLNNTAGDFSVGHGLPIITLAIKTEEVREHSNSVITENILITPLICYEDVVSTIAAHGSRNGAQLLVNITNDAWFGESVAPFQHHQIALFRAIENRRTLLRTTNTGLTALVAPTGETMTSAIPFITTTLKSSAPLLRQTTLFSNFQIGRYWNILAILCSSLSIFVFFTIRKRAA